MPGSDIVVRVGADIKALGDNTKAAAGDLGTLEKSVGGLGSTLSRVVGGPMSGLVDSLGHLGIAAIGFKALATGLGSVATGMVSGNAEMETYETQLGTLLGSADAAKERLAELAKFGAETPFDLPEVVRAEKVLLGFGLTGQHVLDVTGKNATQFRTLVGDIAAGTGASFEEIALNMGKFASGATGEAISRFQEMGIATREQMAALGVEFSKSGELLSPLPKAMQAIVQISQQKFGGGMEKLSKTFEGQMSTLSDNLNQAKNVVMQPIFDVLKDSVAGLNDVLSGEGFQSALRSVAQVLSGVVAKGVQIATQAFIALKDFVTSDFDLGLLADDLREAFGIDITPLLGPYVKFRDILDTVVATVSEVATRLATFFGSLASGETLATAVNKAFGDLIPFELNAALDAIDQGFASLKQTMADLVAAEQSGGVGGVFETIIAKLREGGAAETAGAFEDALAQIRTALDNVAAAIPAVTGAIGAVAGLFDSGAQNGVAWGRVLDAVFGAVVRGIVAPITGFNQLVQASLAAYQGGSAAFVALQQAIESAWQAVTGATTTTWQAITGSLIGTWQAITGTIAGATAAVVGTVSGAWNAVMGITDSNGVTLRQAITSNWQAISAWTQTYWQQIRDAVSSWLGSTESAVRSATDSISGYTSQKWGEVTSATSRAWDSVASTVRDALDVTAVPAVRGAWDSIKSLTDTAHNGAGGVVSTVSSAWSSVKSSIGSALDATSGAQAIVASALGAIAGLLERSGIADAAATFGSQLVSGIIGALGSLASGLSNAISAAIRSIDVTIGIFHVHGGTVDVNWPTISPPKISSSSLMAADVSGAAAAAGAVQPLSLDYDRLSRAVAANSGSTYSLTYTGGAQSDPAPRELERMMQRMAAFG